MIETRGRKRTDTEYRLSIRYGDLEPIEPYINGHVAILHRWIECGHEVMLLPSDVLRKNRILSCSLCKGTRLSIDLYKQKVREKHGDKIKVLSSHYINNITPLRHKCTVCGHKWQARPDSVSNKNATGCPACRNKKLTKTHEAYVKELKKLSKNKIIIVGGYVNAVTKVEHKCTVCEYTWTPAPRQMLRKGSGCPRCQSTAKYSQTAITWIKKLEKKLKVSIQHAENGGEFSIPGTRWQVDGYAPEINTAFEFYGDAFHGNPILFGPNEYCHPFNKLLKARALYRLTIKRHSVLEEMGYKVIHVWETDFKKGLLQSKRL